MPPLHVFFHKVFCHLADDGRLLWCVGTRHTFSVLQRKPSHSNVIMTRHNQILTPPMLGGMASRGPKSSSSLYPPRNSTVVKNKRQHRVSTGTSESKAHDKEDEERTRDGRGDNVTDLHLLQWSICPQTQMCSACRPQDRKPQVPNGTLMWNV